MKYPDNNPKTASGMTKVPLHLVPPSAEYFLALALADGARKYGPYNWREAAISTSVYVAACKRHIAAFWDGETLAPDSGVHHLAHAMACIALMLDAMSVGKLHDDRPPAGNVSALHDTYAAKQPVCVEPVTHLGLITGTSYAAILKDDPKPKLNLAARTIEEWEASQKAIAEWEARNLP